MKPASGEVRTWSSGWVRLAGLLVLAGCTTANHSPELVPPGDVVVDLGSMLSIDIKASDPDGDTVTLALETAPQGAQLTGKHLTWTPDASGVDAFVISATDDGNPPATSYAAFSVTVPAVTPPPNRAPSIGPVDDVTLSVGDDLDVELSATDPDGDTLTYAIESAPAGAVLTGATVTWTPAMEDVGSHPFLVSVTDSGEPPLTDQALFTVTVVDPNAPPPNHPPVADAVPDQEVYVGTLLSLVPTASDPDPGDTLTWEAIDLPDGASFVPATATLTWTPSLYQVGTDYAYLRVQDDGVPPLYDDVLVRIDVLAPPSGPPVFTDVPGQATWGPCAEHHADFTAEAPDGMPVTMDLSNPPAGVTLTQVSQALGTTVSRLDWTPAAKQAGPYQIRVYAVEDGTGETSVTTFSVTVPASDPPQVEPFVEVVGGETAVLAHFDACYTPALSGAPDGWAWDGATGDLTWQSTPQDFGIYDIDYTFTDSEVPPNVTQETSRLAVNFSDDLQSIADYSNHEVFQPCCSGDDGFEVVQDANALDGWAVHSWTSTGAEVTARSYQVLGGGVGQPLAAVSYNFRAYGQSQGGDCAVNTGHLAVYDFGVTDPGTTWADPTDYLTQDAAVLEWVPSGGSQYTTFAGFGALPNASNEVTLAMVQTDESDVCGFDTWWDQVELEPRTVTPIEVEIDWKNDCATGSAAAVVKASGLPAGTYRLTALDSGATVFPSPTEQWSWSISCEGLSPENLHTDTYYPSAADAFANLVAYQEDVPFAGGDLVCGIQDDPCSDNRGSIRFRMAFLHP